MICSALNLDLIRLPVWGGLYQNLEEETELRSRTIGHPCAAKNYSHSMVPGGLLVMSYVTRLMPRTSLMMRVAVSPRNSWVKG